MVESMTGFGSAERGGFKVEMRSLNHRYLEMFVRIPSGLSSHEMRMREMIKNDIARGKVDVFVTLREEGNLSLSLNQEAAREIYSALEGLAVSIGISGDITMDTLLQWKGMFISEEVSYDTEPLHEALEAALGELKEMRLREGEGLKSEMLSIAGRIDKLNSDIESLCPAARLAAIEKFGETLRELLRDESVEEGRLLQEASSIADRIDIAEEVARVKSHLEQMREMLENGGTVGRKLDFLMQELIREANTMGSKSGESEILGLVIDMKSEIERAREQVQNIQ
jgi:uncharacterized protein (TIGR00255 family)